MPAATPARAFVAALKAQATPAQAVEVARFFRVDPAAPSRGNRILGVRFGDVFALAKAHADMSLVEVERLLESPFYEARMGGVSIMDFQARARRTSDGQRKALFDLYLRRHDRINNWDLVDRAAPHVIGGYLVNQPRDVLYELARSPNPWERRTAIVATWFFIRRDDLDDTYGVAELLLQDSHDLVQKAVGSWLREAGKRDERRLVRFLRAHATSIPRPMLRLAIEKLPAATRATFD